MKTKIDARPNLSGTSPKKTYARRKRLEEEANAIPEVSSPNCVVAVTDFQCSKIKLEAEDASEENNKELKRLQFYGAGPKMAGYIMEKHEKTRIKSGSDIDPVSTLFDSTYFSPFSSYQTCIN